MECGERPAAQVLAAPQPLRSRQWLLCGMHLYLATGRCWPIRDGRVVVSCQMICADLKASLERSVQ